jgi:hypothetical protein
MYQSQGSPLRDPDIRPNVKSFSFEMANMFRVFGKDWHSKWEEIAIKQLKNHNQNTLGNHCDQALFGKDHTPYVYQLPRFPGTKETIFRDFPDVLSEEYTKDSSLCAEALKPYADDPCMIGYFLRNEPFWAFVEHVIIADEVLRDPKPSKCKDALIEFLKNKYNTIETLNKTWSRNFNNFKEFRTPIINASEFSSRAAEDQHEFSKILIRAYVEIPAKACRAVDKNHLDIGMRWAWVSDADIVSGWECFDIFSINCYSVDPTDALNNVVRLGVDLPVLIGEFHFGALDWGQPSTGLEGVASQEDRAKAFAYYTERTAAHPAGVGCHWFQFYDLFPLGRFDGKNYNIGFFDQCTLPNEILMPVVRECGNRIYDIAYNGKTSIDTKPKSIPMVGFSFTKDK